MGVEGLSLPLFAYRNHFRTHVTVVSGGKICDFGGYVCDPRFFMVVFQTTLVITKSSLYPPGIFNIVLKEKFFFRSVTSILLTPPFPKQLGYANPC